MPDKKPRKPVRKVPVRFPVRGIPKKKGSFVRMSKVTIKKLKSLKNTGESYECLIKRSMLKPKRRRRK